MQNAMRDAGDQLGRYIAASNEIRRARWFYEFNKGEAMGL
jgi:hypothetical protein